MGHSQVYDCLDVNGMTQILMQAACFQAARSFPSAVTLENVKWIPAVEQSRSSTHEQPTAQSERQL